MSFNVNEKPPDRARHSDSKEYRKAGDRHYSGPSTNRKDDKRSPIPAHDSLPARGILEISAGGLQKLPRERRESLYSNMDLSSLENLSRTSKEFEDSMRFGSCFIVLPDGEINLPRNYITSSIIQYHASIVHVTSRYGE